MKSENVRRIAEEVASGINADVEILAAIPARGGSSYVELLMLDNRQADPEPRRVLVGATRTSSEAAFRGALQEQFQHLKQHGRGDHDG